MNTTDTGWSEKRMELLVLWDEMFIAKDRPRYKDEFEIVAAKIQHVQQEERKKIVEFLREYKFQLYSADKVLQQGNEILSHISREDNLIKAEDLNKALEAALETPS